MNCVIIDDEQLAREIVKKYLNDFPEINIVKECENGFEGVKAINELKPDLIFLDIQMPKLTGFELLEIIEHKPNIIFTTAYDEYAIKAFEHNAIDYLLKPFSKDRFKQAVSKIKEKDTAQSEKTEVEKINNFRESSEEIIDRVVVKQGAKIVVIDVDTIQYIEAQDDYVMIYTNEGRFLKQNTMKFFETHLPKDGFIRIHRSYIVNVNEIAELQRYEKESFLLKLKNGNKLKVSKSGYQKLKEKLRI